ncbi:MAG: trigger factor [Holosporales bacterium]|jgi:trigger factor|nr:trigger factor [Holosporales bacterium]
MRIIQESVGDFLHHYEVLLPSAEIADKVKAKLTHIASSVRIPGFRPGKAPLAVVKRQYEAFTRSEEVEKLISDSIKTLVKDSKKRLSRDPQVKLLSDTEEGVTLSVDLDVLPIVDAPKDFSDFSLTRLIPKIEEANIDERLDSIRKTHKGWKDAPAKHKAKNGDQLVVDLSIQTKIAQLQTKGLNPGETKDFSFVLGNGQFVKEFDDHFIDTVVGDNITFFITYPKNFHDKRFARAKVQYTALIKKVRLSTTFDSNEDLAKDLEFDSIKACREAIKKSLEAEYKELSDLYIKRHVLDILSERHVFAVPIEMEEAEFIAIWREFNKENKNKLTEIPQEKIDLIKADYKNVANRRVRLGLLIAEIGKNLEIKVTPKEIEENVIKIAERNPQNAKSIYRYYMNNNQALSAVRASIFEDKVVACIIEKAQISEKTASLKELEEIIEKEDAFPSESVLS